MADNTTLDTGSGGDTIRTLEDGSSIKWPVGVVAYATSVGTPDVLSIPTAAALADNTINPTTLLSGACALWYDGSTWDLARGDATNGLLVNLGSNNDVTLATLPDTSAGDLAAMRASLGGTLTVGSHAVTNAGTFAVQESGAALTALQVMDDWDNAASDGASVSGDVAHDTADAGEPVKIGAKATTSQHGLTLVADADRTNLLAGVDGIQLTRPHTNLESIVSGNASNTDGASTECIGAAGSGVKTYLTTIILTNTSSSNIYVEIKDGSTTKLTIPVPANGGACIALPVPIGGTANTAWNFDASAATTTLYCSMVGFRSKV